MITNSLPQKPTVDQINRSGQDFGQMLIDNTTQEERRYISEYGRHILSEMLIDNTTQEERRYISEYGRHILSEMPPTSGLTMRFFRELADLTPRMTGYSVAVARMSLYQDAIIGLQHVIATYVACVDAAQEVS